MIYILEGLFLCTSWDIFDPVYCLVHWSNTNLAGLLHIPQVSSNLTDKNLQDAKVLMTTERDYAGLHKGKNLWSNQFVMWFWLAGELHCNLGSTAEYICLFCIILAFIPRLTTCKCLANSDNNLYRACRVLIVVIIIDHKTMECTQAERQVMRPFCKTTCEEARPNQFTVAFKQRGFDEMHNPFPLIIREVFSYCKVNN